MSFSWISHLAGDLQICHGGLQRTGVTAACDSEESELGVRLQHLFFGGKRGKERKGGAKKEGICVCK